MKIRVKKEILEGELYPRGYGFAYWDAVSQRAILYPIGINIFVWLLREIYFKTRTLPMHEVDKTLEDVYRQGFRDGRNSK